MNKAEYRRDLQSSWESLSREDLAGLSRSTFKTIITCREWKEASTLLAYLAMEKEISLDKLILHSLDSGKTVYVPRVEGRAMSFYRIFSLHPSGLSLNPWGIREPSDLSEKYSPRKKTLVLVPGLGFTAEGKRLGRGGGYYDRFLEAVPRINTMGICWSGVMREDLPEDKLDKRVNSICCEDRLIRIRDGNRNNSFYSRN